MPIRFGTSLQIKVMCPDCDKPMTIQRQPTHSSVGAGVEGDFVCVSCYTEDCINRYFMTTIEKKTGMVVFTNAMYAPPRESDDTWSPMYVQYIDAKGNKIE